MRPDVRGTRSWAWLAVLAVAVLGLAACEGDEDPLTVDGVTVTTDPPDRLPEWIIALSPEPGAQATGNRVVEVDARPTTGVRQIRLEIDGVDVTAFATEPHPPDPTEQQVTRPNRLAYDPNRLDRGRLDGGTGAVTAPERREQGEQAPVDLEPGPHFATVRLVEFPEGLEADEAVEVDSFTWSFEIL